MTVKVGRWRSRAAWEEFHAAYESAMGLLPTPSRTLDVPTRFGTVRAYGFSPAQPTGIPVLMCPGRSSGAAMWFKNLPALSQDREVILFDALGDTGLSTQTRPLTSTQDQADYVAELIGVVAAGPVHLVGHSFGGALAAATAVRHPDCVQSLSLLEPVFVFGWPRLEVLALAVPASLPFLPQRWRDAILARIGGQSPAQMDDPLAQMIAVGARSYQASLPVPHPLSDQQLRDLHVPLLLAMADHSIMGGAKTAVDRARRLVPQAQAQIWPNTTHSLPMEVTNGIDATLAAFFRQHERPSASTQHP